MSPSYLLVLHCTALLRRVFVYASTVVQQADRTVACFMGKAQQTQATVSTHWTVLEAVCGCFALLVAVCQWREGGSEACTGHTAGSTARSTVTLSSLGGKDE